jgi:hypothetical protein
MKTTTPFHLAPESISMLKANFHKLCIEHDRRTLDITRCLSNETPGIENAVKQLLQNQMDIGNAIKPYYGATAGRKLTQLLFLYGHINIMAEVVRTAKIGKTVSLYKANKKWHDEANEIALFLNNIIPEEVLKELKSMLSSRNRQKAEPIELRNKNDIPQAAFINSKLPEKLKTTIITK